jgi:hypothetical protein
VIRRSIALFPIFAAGCASLLGLEEPEFQTDVAASANLDASNDIIASEAFASPPIVADAGSDVQKDADATLPVSGLIDDFNRGNASALGNGWIEKTAGVFDLLNNAAELVVGNVDYRDALVYRAPGEELVDVTIGATLYFESSVGSAFIAARVQNAGAAQSFFGYYVVVSNDLQMIQVIRQSGGTAVLVGSSNLADPLALKTTYRLVLSVKNNGSIPELKAELRQLSNGGLLGSAAAADSTPNRITTAGSVGFGAQNTLGARTRFDDYSRTSP